MDDSIFLGLIRNTAILLCFSILYEYFWLGKLNIRSYRRQFFCGIVIGVIGIILMMSGWKASSGMTFDTRSVILSISGLFFGGIPTVIAMIITGIYRFSLGGDGIYMGIAVIISSGTIGIFWKSILPKIDNQLKWLELLLMGFTVHAAMLLCTLLLPEEKIFDTITYLILPILTIYPISNMLLGLFMNRQMENSTFRRALSNSEEKYSRLYETMTDAFLVMDLDHNLLECNTALQEMLGYDEEELLSVNCRKLTPDKWLDEDDRIIKEEVLLKGSSGVYEKECLAKDGRIIPVELRIDLLKDEFGEPKALWAIVRDISVRKENVRLVESEKSRLKTLLETVPEMIWLKDRQGVYLECNNNFAEFNGVKKENLIGKTDFFMYEDDIARFYIKKDVEVLELNDTVRFVSLAKSAKTEKEILTETIKTPMYDSEGNTIGVLGVSRDISEIKKAESDLMKAKEKAEESDKLKSIFLANMSHEIRTPMNAIMGFSELLVDSQIDEVERSQYVNIIQHSGNRLLQIIDDIVDLSKLEMNQVAIKKQDLNLFELLRGSVEVLQRNELLQSKPGLDLVLNYSKEHENLVLNTDENRFSQILDNLINNSIKFSESGKIEVGFELVEIKQKYFVEIYVKDEGMGIAKDKHDVIFERFRQGDEEQFNDGTGLGLSICKGLIELLEGDIRFESELGEGSTFYFTIPVKCNGKTKISSGEENTCCEDLARKKILIAESDYNSFLYVKKLFEEENVEISHADNGTQMLQVAKEIVPDVILIDINMPGEDCIECLDELKQTDVTSKIIAQTANVVKGEEEKCIEAGCHGYITKPFSKEELFSEVRRVLV